MVGGALLSLANPYWSFWWATVGISTMTTLAVTARHTRSRGLHLSATLPVTSSGLHLVAIVFATGRRFITDRVYQTALYVFGIVLALFGLYFIWYGGTALLALL